MQNEAKQEHVKLLNNVLGVEARKWGNARQLPAAIRITEKLEPVGGNEIPVYPASYPNSGGDPIYDFNGKQFTPNGDVSGYLHCVIDSYQSQANRMEPAFKETALRSLVPQIQVTVPRKKDAAPEDTTEQMSVLDVAHRVADFRIRLSDRAADFKEAIKSFDSGDALPLVKLLPTSILFGFWDSRDLGTKHARILMSRIDAFDVIPCQKHSIYTGQYSKDEFVNLLQISNQEADDKVLSERGFSNAPGNGLGGVLVKGGILRTSVLSLTDISRIHCLKGSDIDVEKTNAARRYLFCLGLIAEAYQRETNNYSLRSGCELQRITDEEYELRGGSENAALLSLCKDQCGLVKLAEEAIGILKIKEDFSLIVTPGSLKAEFDEAVGKKTVKKAIASARKAAKTAPAEKESDSTPR